MEQHVLGIRAEEMWRIVRAHVRLELIAVGAAGRAAQAEPAFATRDKVGVRHAVADGQRTAERVVLPLFAERHHAPGAFVAGHARIGLERRHLTAPDVQVGAAQASDRRADQDFVG